MGNYKTVLLATFTNDDYLDSVVRRIFNSFTIENDRVFIFLDEDNEQKKIITYNVLVPAGESVDISNVKSTIRINRKKDSNTLYTINALNKIVYKEIGSLDPNHKIKWENYQNTLIVSDEEIQDVTLIKTEIYNVITRKFFFSKFGGTAKKQLPTEPITEQTNVDNNPNNI